MQEALPSGTSQRSGPPPIRSDHAPPDRSKRRRPLTEERPFPGPEPYAESDAEYFHGRGEEINQLERLVQRGPLSVLFGASGLGKSSLLMAGLFPRLRALGFFPVRVLLSFGDDTGAANGAVPDLSRQIVLRLREAAQSAGVDMQDGEDRGTLWEFFHRVEVWSPTSALLKPTIVLDQFEEVFTLGDLTAAGRAGVRALFEALGDLVENRIPLAVEKEIRGKADDRAKFADRQPPARVILSLREEYVPYLEDRRRELPSVIQNRSRIWLRPFGGERAKSIVLESAGHLLTDGVAETVIRSVAARRTGGRRTSTNPSAAVSVAADRQGKALVELTVEPALLNLFCYQLNERRLRTGAPKIDADLVQHAGEDILSDFYADCLRGFKRPVRRFVETQLLSPSGHRLPIPVEDASRASGMSEGTLQVLQERRLIRKELRSDLTYVELVHDVLADTIVRVIEKRREQRGLWFKAGLWVVVAAILIAAGVAGYLARVDSRIQQAQGADERIRQASDAERKAATEKEQAKDAEQRAKDAEQRAKDAEQRAKDAEQRAKDTEQRAKDAEQRAKDAEQRAKDAEQRAKTENKGLIAAKKALEDAKKELEDAKKKATDAADTAADVTAKARRTRMHEDIPDSLE